MPAIKKNEIEFNKINFKILEDCIYWNEKCWARSLKKYLNESQKSFYNLKVLEIGAGKMSALSPFFASIGANVVCSYYEEEFEGPITKRINALRKNMKLINL